MAAAGEHELRFDGRVAIVTGAGRGLGRAHALLLADRGAKVVVVDVGGATDGTGADPAPAVEVVREIADRGGEAIACTDSVTDHEAMQAMVASAVATFGRVDAVVNNAGILTVDDFATLPLEVFQRHLQVHLVGAFNVTQAAWPELVRQRYGRVVVTVSAGLLGSANLVSYGTAKAGLVGFMRSLAQAGAPHGIRVNAFSPSAHSRMVEDLHRAAGTPKLSHGLEEDRGRPEDVAPVAVFLAHEECPSSGEILTSTGTNTASLFIGATRGYTAAGLTVEDVRANWDAMVDREGYFAPRSNAESKELRAALASEARRPAVSGPAVS
jgi:NAD(P)-dependent dehydrogenase (short-subunit alcohol dehydrogenase family)